MEEFQDLNQDKENQKVLHWDELLESVAEEGQTVLEIGASLGKDSEVLERLGAKVIAVDISPKKLVRAKQRGIERPVAMNMESLGLPDNSVDKVFFANSLIFGDSKAALNEAHRIVKPGGRVIVCTNFIPEVGSFPSTQAEVENAARLAGLIIHRSSKVLIPEKERFNFPGGLFLLVDA